MATAVGIVIFSYGVRTPDIRASALDAIRIARLVTALMALVAIVAMLLARPLLKSAPSARTTVAASRAFRLVMLGALANSYSTMLYPCLSAQGLARWGIAAFALGSAVAALVHSWLLTPALGLTGAGLAYALAQTCAVAVIVLAYRRRFGIRGGRGSCCRNVRTRGRCARSVAGRWGGCGVRWVANVIYQPRRHLKLDG